MCDGAIEIFGNCVSVSTLVLWVAIGGIVLTAIGIWLFQISNSSDENESGDMFSNPSGRVVSDTEDESGHDGEALENEEYYHPYKLDDKVRVGESESGLEAYLIIKSYQEEDEENDAAVFCKLLVKAPEGAINMTINHEYADTQIGTVSLQYELNGDAMEQKIHLSDTDLEESDYEVIINIAQTSKLDLKSTN